MRHLFIASSVFISLLAWPGFIYAGGGAFKPLNFVHWQQLTGKSFSPEIRVMDPASGYSTPLAGRTFIFKATNSLPGSVCTTTQGTSDSNGLIKADCKADAFGKFDWELVDSSDQSAAVVFTVFLTESETGFPTTGSSGLYTMKISPSELEVAPDESFILTAEIYENNVLLESNEAVSAVYWQVLEGSLVGMNSEGEKNRAVRSRLADSPKTIVRASARMNSGEEIYSGSITIRAKTTSTLHQTTPTLTSTPQPQVTQIALSPTTIASPTPQLKVVELIASAGSELDVSDVTSGSDSSQLVLMDGRLDELEERMSVLERALDRLINLVSSLIERFDFGKAE